MTRTLHFVFIALTLAAALFAQSADNDAWSLFRRRDYRAALEQMSKDVKSTPDSAALHDGIGWCHYFLGAYDDAEQAFANALARDAEYKWSKQGLEALAAVRKAPLEQADALFAAGRYLDARVAYLQIAAGETAAPASASADAHTGDGWCLYYLARYDEAVKAFQRALKARGDCASAARGIGFCKYASGAWADALVSLQLSFKSEPEHYEARLICAWCYFKKGDLTAARREFQRATEMTAEAWGAELGLAWCAREQSKEAEAFEHFRDAITFSPYAFSAEVKALTDARKDWWPLYRTAGWSALRTRLDSLAFEHFTAARNLIPNDVDALRGLAFANFHLANYDAALKQADECGAAGAALEPVRFPATAGAGARAEVALDLDALRGWSYYRVGQFDKALERFRAVRAQHGDWVDALCGEGWSLYSMGEMNAAESAFAEAQRVLPGYVDAVSGAAALETWRNADYDAAWRLLDAGEFAKAVAALRAIKETADERFPRAKRAWIDASIGWAFARSGDVDEAQRSFEAALAAAPQLGLAHKGWGWMLMQSAQWPAAAARLEQAAQCADLAHDAEAAAMLGWAQYRTNALERAATTFERAKELDANSAYALSGLAAVMLARKQVVEARIELERAVQLDPTLEDAEWLRACFGTFAELDKLYSPLGWAWYARNDWARAEADFRRAVEKDPLEPTAKRGLALTLVRAGKLELGKELMTKYLATLPKKESGWGALSSMLSDYGWTLFAGGDFAGGQKVFKQLVELHAGDKVQYAEAWDGLGWCAARQGRVKEAREAFLKAIAIQPRYESSLKGLESLVGRE